MVANLRRLQETISEECQGGAADAVQLHLYSEGV